MRRARERLVRPSELPQGDAAIPVNRGHIRIDLHGQMQPRFGSFQLATLQGDDPKQGDYTFADGAMHPGKKPSPGWAKIA